MTTTRPPKLNAATHWMTARHALIPGESQEALQAHLDHWNFLYPGVETDELLNDLVAEAAFSSWLLIRSQRHYDSEIASLYQTLMEAWTPAQHNTFQLRERYLNSAQRALNRHRSNILQYQASLRSQAREDRSAKEYAAAQKVKNPEKPEPDPRSRLINNNTVVQLATIGQKDGQTETFLTPDNRHMLEHMAALRYETTLVYRSIRFENHVCPPEYEAFAERVAELKKLPKDVRINIPITFRSLRIAVEREKEFGGHIREWPDLEENDAHMIKIKQEEIQLHPSKES